MSIALICLMVPAGALAQGGPPLITDDPDTPGPGHWEINLASLFERSQPQRRLEAPLADVNYGVGQRIQLKSSPEFVVNIGGRQKITRHTVLLVAVGNGISGLPEDRLHLRLYLGLQVRRPLINRSLAR